MRFACKEGIDDHRFVDGRDYWIADVQRSIKIVRLPQRRNEGVNLMWTAFLSPNEFQLKSP
jgi:hypothetical protein